MVYWSTGLLFYWLTEGVICATVTDNEELSVAEDLMGYM